MKKALAGTLFVILGCVTGAAVAQESAPDDSKWLFLTRAGPSPVIVSEEVQGQAVKTVSVYTILTTRSASGVDGVLTTFEVNCPKRTLTDVKSTAFDGSKAIGKMASLTKGQPAMAEPGTFFGAVGLYACARRTESGDKKVIVGKEAAIKYAKAKATGASNPIR